MWKDERKAVAFWAEKFKKSIITLGSITFVGDKNLQEYQLMSSTRARRTPLEKRTDKGLTHLHPLHYFIIPFLIAILTFGF